MHRPPAHRWLAPPPGRAARLTAAAALAALACGCSGARVQRLEEDLQAVRDELDELKRSQAAARVQADELKNRMVMIEEKADSARVDRARSASGWIPSLQTVRVAPQAARAPVAADPSDDEESEDQLPAQAAAVAPPVASGPAADLPPQLDTAKPKGDPAVALYNQAKALLDGEQYLAARALFQKLRDGHPDHDLADNALYWIGESWYAQAQWLQAAQAFLKVAKEYPRGNKVPDAMYKLARSYEKVGDDGGALEVLRQLTKHYPGTPAAKKASEDLARLAPKGTP